MMIDFQAIVLGDVMLDRYLEGHIYRISPEAPVPVVSLEREWATLGGAGNVAASLAGLGCRVTLAGIVGADEEGRWLQRVLNEAGVAGAVLIERDDLRTICKTRVVASGQQQVVRLDQDGDRAALRRAAADLEEQILPSIREYDVVVLSDYDKGTITESLARLVLSECRKRGVPCVVDSKKTDFTVFTGATLLTPNVMEASRALGRSLDDVGEIVSAAIEARTALRLDHLLITRGPDGMTLASADGIAHFPAEVREVADVTGAGDTVIATLAAWLGSGHDIKEACRIASVAAGIAVGHRGCYVVKTAELEGALRGRSPKVHDRETARRWVAAQRRADRKIVFTNGCFDILHPGHLASLEGARRLGDLLVVGLNSDASVRRLKGDSRPTMSQESRAQLLAGLSCVDIVVVFDESTPEELVRLLEPDVLVKGGDYRVEEIAGSDFVRGRGGKVVTLPLLPGFSTTSILSKRGLPP
jgi:D-beta-D-heptose 7-phosphate kinase / D-beta-D-heptose 1-phosphate adenosyltransferase